jgi:hypothetical protein
VVAAVQIAICSPHGGGRAHHVAVTSDGERAVTAKHDRGTLVVCDT